MATSNLGLEIDRRVKKLAGTFAPLDALAFNLNKRKNSEVGRVITRVPGLVDYINKAGRTSWAKGAKKRAGGAALDARIADLHEKIRKADRTRQQADEATGRHAGAALEKAEKRWRAAKERLAKLESELGALERMKRERKKAPAVRKPAAPTKPKKGKRAKHGEWQRNRAPDRYGGTRTYYTFSVDLGTSYSIDKGLNFWEVEKTWEGGTAVHRKIGTYKKLDTAKRAVAATIGGRNVPPTEDIKVRIPKKRQAEAPKKRAERGLVETMTELRAVKGPYTVISAGEENIYFKDGRGREWRYKYDLDSEKRAVVPHLEADARGVDPRAKVRDEHAFKAIIRLGGDIGLREAELAAAAGLTGAAADRAIKSLAKKGLIVKTVSGGWRRAKRPAAAPPAKRTKAPVFRLAPPPAGPRCPSKIYALPISKTHRSEFATRLREEYLDPTNSFSAAKKAQIRKLSDDQMIRREIAFQFAQFVKIYRGLGKKEKALRKSGEFDRYFRTEVLKPFNADVVWLIYDKDVDDGAVERTRIFKEWDECLRRAAFKKRSTKRRAKVAKGPARRKRRKPAAKKKPATKKRTVRKTATKKTRSSLSSCASMLGKRGAAARKRKRDTSMKEQTSALRAALRRVT